jgi:beta-phosphoglucomutase-like phosphatase (HAD superfamily)
VNGSPRLDGGAARALLLDADDCLFPSERPAFEASTEVTNRLLDRLGIDLRFSPDELRARAVGRNFRATATDLAAEHGMLLDDGELERWVGEERRAVTERLRRALSPDPAVREPVAALAERYRLAVVSSSALERLDACFEATGLGDLLPPEVRFSAEDSLPAPASKPDPAVYALAGRELAVTGAEAVAVEDSVSGTRSATLAGFPVVGMLLFVDESEREARAAALREAGAARVVDSWRELAALLAAESAAALR